MTASSPWCCGWPTSRPPHVPTGGLVVIDSERGVQLCREACWPAWVRDDGEVSE